MAIRKKRKPMTPEQKAALVDRLAKAREKRMRENPPQYKNIHPSVIERSEDDPFYFRKIQDWIKTQKQELSSARSDLRKKIKGAESRVANHSGYIRNLEKFLRDGVYVDLFYGEYAQNKIRYWCHTPAYYPDGTQKFSYGVFYPSLGYTYEGEHSEEEHRKNEYND